jgi:G:T-mismatch repair DNA endonuclease (very short patch repair protein)
MRLTELNGKKVIFISDFYVCLIDGATKKDILKLYPGRKNGAYYLNKFNNYLKDNYNIDLKTYLLNYLKKDYPKCIATKEYVNFKVSGVGVIFNDYIKGVVNKNNCENFAKGCKKLSKERMGINNPMYGKESWNKGLNKNTHPSLKIVSEKQKLRKFTKSIRAKMSASAKKRTVHGHTGKKHSKKTLKKLSEITAKRFKDGIFNKKSKIHIKVENFLKKNGFDYVSEYHLKYYSLDIAFPNEKICVEIQGTFFHCDPRKYPNGPITKIQSRNFGRDKAKKKYLHKKGWNILEIWETEINNNEYEKSLLCNLKKLKVSPNRVKEEQ